MKKKLVIGLMMATALATLTGCSTNTSGNGEGKRQLVISTWGLSEDIVADDVYKPFEEAYDVEVVLEIGTTSERYTKFANDPHSPIDIIDLSQSKAAEGYDAGLFEAIDMSQIENAALLIPAAKELMEDGAGAPYTVNSIGIIYDEEAIGFEITSFDDLWRPELLNRISIPEITSTFGPAMMYAASDYAGVDITTDNGEAAFEALEALKPNIVKTYTKSSDLANMFASGEIAVAVVGDFAIPTIQGAAPHVKYINPEAGTYANFNTVNINPNSENKDLAYAFINWRLSGELQAKTAVSLNEAPTNSTVELTEEVALNKTYGDIANNAKPVDYRFVNPLMSEWIDKWNRILNS